MRVIETFDLAPGLNSAFFDVNTGEPHSMLTKKLSAWIILVARRAINFYFKMRIVYEGEIRNAIQLPRRDERHFNDCVDSWNDSQSQWRWAFFSRCEVESGLRLSVDRSQAPNTLRYHSAFFFVKLILTDTLMMTRQHRIKVTTRNASLKCDQIGCWVGSWRRGRRDKTRQWPDGSLSSHRICWRGDCQEDLNNFLVEPSPLKVWTVWGCLLQHLWLHFTFESSNCQSFILIPSCVGVDRLLDARLRCNNVAASNFQLIMVLRGFYVDIVCMFTTLCIANKRPKREA